MAVLLAALHACTAEGMTHSPLDGSPTKHYNHLCYRTDVPASGTPDIGVLNSWLDIGSDYNAQVTSERAVRNCSGSYA